MPDHAISIIVVLGARPERDILRWYSMSEA
jgi:hypothetical protein